MSSTARLTATSYSVLGLLAIQPWTTYELIQQVERSTRRIWPRAQSKLYEEPKKLVALGLARATDEHVGRRRRTRYRITAKGRRALADWLAIPGAGPVLEVEQLLQVHFADCGTKRDLLTTIAAAGDWAHEQNTENLAAGRAYLDGTGPFLQRGALNLLVGRFLTDFYELVASWSDWATEMVEAWPEKIGEATLDRDALAEAVQRAERVDARRRV